MWAVSQEICSPLWLLCKKVQSWSKSKDRNHGIKQKVWLRNKSIAKSPYDISLQASVKYTEPKAWITKKNGGKEYQQNWSYMRGIVGKRVKHLLNKTRLSVLYVCILMHNIWLWITLWNFFIQNRELSCLNLTVSRRPAIRTTTSLFSHKICS
jgi:hypothetical protein